MGENAYLQQRVKELHALHKEEPTDLEDVQRLMRQELDIFVDILPGYKVKDKYKQKNNDVVQRSRTVLEVERLEEQTVQLYEKYLGHLRRLAEQEGVPAVAGQAAECLAGLLQVASSFNFAARLVETVVRCANSHQRRVADPCVRALEQLFDNEGTGEGTLLAVGAISKLIKLKGHAVNPRLVAALVHLRLTDVDVRHATPRDRDDKGKGNKGKTKNHLQEEKKVQNELKLADPTLSKEQVRHLQTALLRRVVAAYLRVLQHAQGASSARQLRLLGPCLEGLAKFARLIDVEMVGLLVQAIRDVIGLPTTTPVVVAHAVLAVASLDRAAQEQHELASVEASRMAISTDLTTFYQHLYRIIPLLLQPPTAAELLDLHKAASLHERKGQDGDPAGGDEDARSIVSGATGATSADKPHLYMNGRAEHTKRVRVLLRALDLLLLQPKRVPLARVMSFAKRLAHVAPHQPPGVAMALVAFLRKLALKHPALADVISGSPEALGSFGHFNAEVDEPDFACSGAQAPPAWELMPLLHSYHPTAGVFTSSVVRSLPYACNPHQEQKKAGKPHASVVPLLQRDPEAVLTLHDIALGDLVPDMALPPPPASKSKHRGALAKGTPSAKRQRTAIAAAAAELAGEGTDDE